MIRTFILGAFLVFAALAIAGCSGPEATPRPDTTTG